MLWPQGITDSGTSLKHRHSVQDNILSRNKFCDSLFLFVSLFVCFFFFLFLFFCFVFVFSFFCENKEMLCFYAFWTQAIILQNFALLPADRTLTWKISILDNFKIVWPTHFKLGMMVKQLGGSLMMYLKFEFLAPMRREKQSKWKLTWPVFIAHNLFDPLT